MKKRIAAILLTLVMIVTYMPNLAWVSYAETPDYWLLVGGTQEITSEHGSNKDSEHSWSSNNAAVSVVNNAKSATISANNATNQTITITHNYNNYGWRSETFTVAVLSSDISFDKTNIILEKNGTETLTLSGLDSRDSITSFASDNTDVVELSGSGNSRTLTAKSPGIAVVTAITTSGLKASCKVTVKGVVINKTQLKKYAGDTAEIKAVLYGGVSLGDNCCESDDADVVSVSRIDDTKKFQLNFNKSGEAIVTITASDGSTATCSVVVVDGLTKTAEWTTEGEAAEIVIESRRSKETINDAPRVLFLGSLCSAHSLTGGTVKDAINEIAKKATVDYKLFGMNVSLLYADDPVEGTLEQGQALTSDFTLRSGYHVSGLYFADVINSIGDDIDQYDLIVMEFDGLRMGYVWGETDREESILSENELLSQLRACYTNPVYGAEYGTGPFTSSTLSYSDIESYFAQAAMKLKPFYDQGKVAWLVPTKIDKKDTKGTTEGGYYMYDDKYITATYTLDWCRKYSYDTMALLSPADWLKTDATGAYIAKKKDVTLAEDGTDAFFISKLTNYIDICTKKQFSDTNKSGMWTTYGNTSDVLSLVETKTSEIADLNTLDLSDVITSGFDVVSVQGQYYNKNNVLTNLNTYTPDSTQSGNFTVDFTADNQGRDKVVGHFNIKALEAKDVKMTIRVKPKSTLIRGGKGDYLIEKDGKYTIETNEGEAVAAYSGKDIEKNNTVKTATLDEPRLRVTKSVAEGSKKSNLKVGDKVNYTIKIENVGTVAIDNIKLTDAHAGIDAKLISQIATDDSVTVDSLASGESTTLTVTCTVGVNDVAKGKIINDVVVTGEDPEDKPVTGTDTNEEATVDTKTDITVKKVWSDGDNQDGKRPDSVSIQLYQKIGLAEPVAVEGKTATLQASKTDTENWQHTFTDLPLSSDGKLIAYSVQETAVTGYTPDYSDISDGVITITNSHTPETITITGTKTWDDNGLTNISGYSQPEITVKLVGKVGEEVVVEEQSTTTNKAKDWKYSFADLPKYNEGSEITYTLTEETPDGFTSEVTDYDVKNTAKVNGTDALTPVSITLKKVDALTKTGTGLKDAVFTLTKKDAKSGTDYTTGNDGTVGITFTEEGTYTLQEKTAPTGYVLGEKPQEYTITVSKDETGVSVSIQGDEKLWQKLYDLIANFGSTTDYDKDKKILTVKNNPATTGVTAEKVWDDNNDQDGVRPTSVKIQLYEKVGDDKETAVADTETTLEHSENADKNWKHTFTDLPLTRDGKAITYSIKELTPGGTSTAIAEGGSYNTDYTAVKYSNNGQTVTNTHTPATTSITVKKAWIDGEESDAERTAVEVTLYADGIATDKKVTLDKGHSWTATFTNLPVKKAGKAISYSVQEAVPTGYAASYSELKDDTITITNTKVTDVTVKKDWNGTAESSATLQLYKQVGSADPVAEGNPVVLTADNNWTYTFEKLPAYTLDDKEVKAITYSVDETTVPEGYQKGISTADDGALVVTNSKLYKVTYEYDDSAPEGVSDAPTDGDHIAGETVTVKPDPETIPAGYTFSGWKTSDATVGNDGKFEMPAKDVKLVGSFTANTNTKYTVEYYYQDDNGKYADELDPAGEPDYDESRTGTTDQTATVTEKDKKPVDRKMGYELDESTGHKELWSATILGNGTTVLKVYFKKTLTELEVTKAWVGTKKDSAQIQLYKKVGSADKQKVGDPVTLNSGNSWKHKFAGLYEYNDVEGTSTKVTYSVEETPITGYKTEYDISDDGKSVKITNTELTELNVKKVWIDGKAADAERTAVVVTLYADKVATDKTVTLNKDNNWTAKFEKLDAYKENNKIEYSVQEAVPTGYAASYSELKDDDTITITNTKSKDIKIRKAWANGTLESATLTLFKKIGSGDAEKVEDVVLNSANSWQKTYQNLPEYTVVDGAIKSISYSVDETTVPEGYKKSISTAEDGSLVVTNSKLYKVTYEYDDSAPEGVSDAPTDGDHIAGETVTVKPGPETIPVGYTFSGWKTSDATVGNDGTFEMPAKDVKLVGSFTANTNTKYTVEYYYQKADGSYDKTPDYDESRTGTTGATAYVTTEDGGDTTPKKDGYVYDNSEAAGNVVSGTIAGDGSLVLKVHFKKQYTVTYKDGVDNEEVFKDVTYPNLDYGVDTPSFDKTDDTKTPTRTGYDFAGWKPTVEEKVTEDKTYVATWTPSKNNKYKVEYYYQNDDGTYPNVADSTSTDRTGTTGEKATVTDADKTVDPTVSKTKGRTYVIDGSKTAEYEKTIAADGSTVLKVYFKQQYTVIYKPGEHGTFSDDEHGSLDYGIATPSPDDSICTEGEPKGEAGYTFTGWSPEPAATVTGNATYVAQWTADKDTGYKVKHWVQTLDGDYELKETEADLDGETDTVVKAKPKEYEGFALSTIEGKNNDVTVGQNLEGDGSTVLNVYYDRVTTGYTVRYMLNGTDIEIADPKSVDKDSSDKDLLYGQSVTESPIDINGYTKVSENDETINSLKADKKDNVIIFYYYQNVTVSGLSDEVVYDGNSHEVNGYDVTDEDGKKITDIKFKDPADTDKDLVVKAEGTYVDEYPTDVPDDLIGKVDTTGKYIVKTVEDGELKITPPDPSVYMSKTHEELDHMCRPGDEIEFTIKVKNIYNEKKTITLEEIEGVTLDKSVFEDVEPGEEITAIAKYIVKSTDITNKSFTNTVIATFSEEDDTPSVQDTVDIEAHSSLTVTKTVVNKPNDGKSFKEGEKVYYEITVTNDGNLTLYEVKVVDKQTGNSWIIPRLEPGDTMKFYSTHEVTPEEAKNGLVVGDVVATGTDELGREVEPAVAEVEVPAAIIPEGAKTGDDSNIFFWLKNGLLSLLAAALVFRRKKQINW